jgi:hypothetical protein
MSNIQENTSTGTEANGKDIKESFWAEVIGQLGSSKNVTDEESDSGMPCNHDWEPTYCYDELDHLPPKLRLLNLLPAKHKTEDIHCTLDIALLAV